MSFKPSTDGTTRTLAVVCTGISPEIRQYLALAHGLQALGGFRVKFVSHAVHSAAAASLGLAFAPLKGDTTMVLRSSAFREAVKAHNMLSIAQLFKKESDSTMALNMPLILAACRDMDGIVCSIGVLTECLAIGQKFQRPVTLAPLLPYSPSGELPLAQVFPQPAKYAFLNKFSYELSGALLWAVMGPTYNRFRTETLRIGPQPGYELQGVPQVVAFSHALVPRPSDWGTHIRATGYWAPPTPTGSGNGGGGGGGAASAASAHLSAKAPRLASLIHAAAGWEFRQRPLVVALEATPPPDTIDLLLAAYAAAERAGVTAVVVSFEGELGGLYASERVKVEMPPDVLWEEKVGGVGSAPPPSSSNSTSAAAAASIPPPGGFPRLIIAPEVPYEWLFPAASCIIHSGGGGVTQAAMHAGVPSIPFPAVGAEFFWAARAGALGVAPPVAYEMREIGGRLGECVAWCARTPAVAAAAAALGEVLRGGGGGNGSGSGSGSGSGAQAGVSPGVASAVAAVRATLSRPQHRNCGVSCTWVPDGSAGGQCPNPPCAQPFTLFNRRKHCRSCGALGCGACFTQRCHLPGFPEDAPQVTCEKCLDHRRAYFATHVHESPLPPLPEGVVLPAVVGVGVGAGVGVGMGGGGGAAPKPASATAGAGASASALLRSPPSYKPGAAPASGSGAGAGSAMAATLSPTPGMMGSAAGGGGVGAATVASPGFDAVNLLGVDSYGLGVMQPGGGDSMFASPGGGGGGGGGGKLGGAASSGSSKGRDHLGKGLAALGLGSSSSSSSSSSAAAAAASAAAATAAAAEQQKALAFDASQWT